MYTYTVYMVLYVLWFCALFVNSHGFQHLSPHTSKGPWACGPGVLEHRLCSNLEQGTDGYHFDLDAGHIWTDVMSLNNSNIYIYTYIYCIYIYDYTCMSLCDLTYVVSQAFFFRFPCSFKYNWSLFFLVLPGSFQPLIEPVIAAIACSL